MAHNISDNILPKALIDEFDQNGVVCLRNVLSKEYVEKLREDVSQIIARNKESDTGYDFEKLQQQVWNKQKFTSSDGEGRFDLEMYELVLETDPEARPIVDTIADGKRGKFYYDAGMWRFYHGIKEVAFDSALPEITARLMDSKYINFWEDTTFVKYPNTSQRTTFHQDWSYFQISGEKCCIAWIPLDVVGRDNGAMEYIKGSHLWGQTYAPNLLISQSIDPTSPYDKLPDIEANRPDYDIITFDVNPGDVIIHHVKTVHGSGGNTSSDKMRRAMAFRYCGDDIRYFDKPGAIEQPYVSQKLKNGERLVSEDYPLVFGNMAEKTIEIA